MHALNTSEINKLTLEQNLLRSRLSSENKLLWLLTYPKNYIRSWKLKVKVIRLLIPLNIPGYVTLSAFWNTPQKSK